jgi:hypothetical protein
MRRALLAVPTAIAVALPAPVGAVTFGTQNLAAREANSNIACGDFNIFQYAGRLGCSAYTTGNAANPADTSATHVIPFPNPAVFGNQTGTITQVTFKPAPGAPAGPARLSVIEYVRQGGSSDPALAQDIADSATFTMTPGTDGLVHVLTDLPARSLFNANDNTYRFDALVVSMLDNTTPIPADLNSQFLSGWISPYVDIPSTNGDLTVPLPADRQGTGCCGYGPNPFYALGAWPTLGEVLMQAELTITKGGPEPPQIGPLRFGRGRLAGNRLTLPLTCELDAVCRGLLQLLRQAGAAAKKKEKKTAVYGRARFSIPAHKTKRVKVKLTKAGKKLMRGRRSTKLLAKATVGSQVATGTVTVKRNRKK